MHLINYRQIDLSKLLRQAWRVVKKKIQILNIWKAKVCFSLKWKDTKFILEEPCTPYSNAEHRFQVAPGQPLLFFYSRWVHPRWAQENICRF